MPTSNTIATFAGASPDDPVTVQLSNSADTVGGMNFSTKTSWTISNGGVAGRTLTFDNTGTTIAIDASVPTLIDAVINGDGITKTGTGTLTLGQVNNYVGGTNINGGAISIANFGALGTSGTGAANLTFDGGQLTYTGGAQSTGRLFQVNAGGATINANGTGAVNFTSAGNITYGTANQTRTLNLAGTNTGANTLTATILNNGTGAVTVNKNGTGTWVMTGTNGYTGGTNVTGGTLQIGNGTAAGSIVGNVVLSSGTTLAFNRVGAADDTFTGTITPATTGGNLSVTGSSKMTFTAVNTYTGTTAISGGADVYANGTLGGAGAGAVTVSGSGSIFGGEGTIAGATTFQTGTTFDIGDGSTAADIGDIELSSSLNLQSGSTMRVDVNSNNTPTAGTTYDQAIVAGTVTLAGTLSVVFDQTGGTTGYDMNTKITIINTSNTITGTFSNYVDGARVVEISGLGGIQAWYIDYDASNGGVFFTPVPEPGTVLGIAAAGLGLARWVRRRRKTEAAPAVPA